MKEKEGEFETNLKKLVAILGGDSVFKKSKLPKDSVSTLVNQLVEEKRQETLTNFKTKAKDLLDKKDRI